jgi:peptidoglycan-associated lipoprotein
MRFHPYPKRFGLVMLILLGAVLALSCSKKTVSAPTPPPPTAPPPAEPTPQISLRATPATIDRGAATTLEWEARNAATVRIEPTIGDVSTNGRRDVSPTSSVTYTATATGPGGTDQAVARVTVNIPAAPPPSEAPRVTAETPRIADMFNQNVQTIYFDYDKAEIRPDQIQRLQSNATWLRQNPNVRFSVEGHCDDRGSQEYNLALGDHRANAIKEFLVAQGINASRFNIISYGEERPVCRDETEECFQKNRRGEFVLTP